MSFVGRFPMRPSLLRLPCLILPVCFLFGIPSAMESQSAWQTSVHQLEIEQTVAGPVIHGMFLWPPPLCQGETPHCIAGSNNPTCCQPLTIPEPQVCAPIATRTYSNITTKEVVVVYALK